MSVCNPTIYTVGMWLQFIDPYAKLQVSAISGNDLTLLNRNENAEAVRGNPSIGTKISKLTKFVVCDSPNDLSATQEREKIEEALSGASELCMSNMASCSATAIIQPVGRIESDPSNLSIKKCIRRIYGILFNAGRPVLTALGAPVDINDMGDYRPLVKHKTSNVVRHRKNYSETEAIVPGKPYLLQITSQGEKVFPSYLTKIVNIAIREPGVTAPADWPVMTTDFEQDFDISDVSGAAPPDGHTLDHYFVMINIEIGGNKSAGDLQILKAYLNDAYVGRCGVSSNNDVQDFSQVTKLVKVMKSNNKLSLRLSTTGSIKYFCRISIDAVLY